MKARPADSSGQDRINATAAAWLVEAESGLSAAQAEAFRQWCDQDVRHQAAVDRLRTTWGKLDRLRGYRPEARLHPDPDLLAPASRPRLFPSAHALAAAAAVLLLLLFGAHHSDRFPQLPWTDTAHYLTDSSGYNRMSLPDGSVMELNSQTEVRVRFSARQRLIRLVRGEGHFVVVPDAGRPFIVETNGLQVKAVGTSFNVRTGEQGIEVLVTHGRVVLAATGGKFPALGPQAPELDAGHRAIVAANDAAESTRAGPIAIESVSREEVRAALAWQNPRLHFTDAPLAEVVRQFNLRSPVQITVADPELAGISIGGSFRVENVEAFVRLLSSANEVVIERPEADRIVLRRAARP